MQTQLRERVLLVDDEPQVLIALEDLLSDKFSVLTTTSPDDALRVLERESDIAVVVTDQRMPRMTGDQMLAKLDASCRALRILVTGFADLNAVIRAVNEGNIFAYVTKPWDAEDLRTKVDRAVERFRSTKELINEQQLLHDLMTHSPDGIYIKDRALRFVQVNRAFAQQTGRASDLELLGKSLPELLHDRALADQTEAEERDLLHGGTPVLDILRADDQQHCTRWYSETKAPIHGRDGAIVGLLGLVRDVTERIASQQALARSEARSRDQMRLLHGVLDNLAEGVIVANSSGDFLLLNQPARRLLGVATDQLDAGSWIAACGIYLQDQKTLLPEQDNPLLRAMAGEPWSEIETFVRNAAVTGCRMIVTGTPLPENDGSVHGGIALLRDVTTHKALEQRLAQAHRLEAVGRLAGGVAHDFNNMLSVIQSCTELMLRRSSDEQQRDDLNQVLAASERAALLTKQLMLFSRQQSSQPETLLLNDVVALLKGVLSRIVSEDVVFTTKLEPTLGMLKADRSQIEQIIVNLTVNARDAMPEGGELCITTYSQRVTAQELEGRNDVNAGEFVVLSVSDTGTGMDTQTQEHMFEPFFTTKAVGKGTGLGLATVYGIVEQNRGFLRCRSKLGEGTCFEVFLPSVAATKLVPEKPTLSPGPRVSKGTILLVEDEDAVRAIAVRLLRTQGYEVLEAHRPSEARRIYAQNRGRIDLLVTDVVMPETSGTQLAKELQQQTPGLHVVFMSGYAGVSAPVREDASSGIWQLDKPFTASTLLAKVGEALKQKT